MGATAVTAAPSKNEITVSGTCFLLNGKPFPYTGISFYNAIYNPTTFKHITSHDLKLGVRWDLTSPAVYAPPPLIRKG